MGNWEFAREFQYYRQGRLVGIGLADVTAESLSSIYFFPRSGLADAVAGGVLHFAAAGPRPAAGSQASLSGLLGRRQPVDGL